MITARTNPDDSGRAWKLVQGWWCPCVGPGAGPGHHASECPRRVPMSEWRATYPGWRTPVHWRAEQEAADDVPRGPIVPCVRMADHELDDAPAAAVRLLSRILKAGRPAWLTYARGWGRRLVPGAGEDGAGKFLPWPVASVVLRAPRLVNVAWTRLDGDDAWKPVGGYGVWAGRIYPVNVTQAGKLISAMTTTKG